MAEMERTKLEPYEEMTDVTAARIWALRPKLWFEFFLLIWSVTLSFIATEFSGFDLDDKSINNEVMAGGLIYITARVFSLLGLPFNVSTHWFFWPVSIGTGLWFMFFWGTASC